MAAQGAVVFTMTALGTLLLVTAGKLVYPMRFEGSVVSMLGGLVVGGLSFFGHGVILAGTRLTARTAQVIAMVLVCPRLNFSGGTHMID